MNLITRCPACDTLFKVVPDQLRVSEGWVRCGQCDEVFDANAHLHSELSAVDIVTTEDRAQENHVAHVPPQVDEAAEAQDTPVATIDSPSDAVIDTPAHEETATVEVVAAEAAVSDMADVDTFLEKSPQELSRLDASLLNEVPGHDLMNDAPGMEQLSIGTEPVERTFGEPRYVQSELPTVASVGHDTRVSFMRDPRAATLWHRPMVRLGLSIACLSLGVLLVLQVLVLERDRIAATQPEARPVLEAMCQMLSCTIAPLRRIEAVVIDSSSFARVRADVYKLSFSLRNAGFIDVATPSLELTLTDMQDQSVIRKVFHPTDVVGLQESMVAGAEINATVPLGVKLAGAAERISGYRLVAFYP